MSVLRHRRDRLHRQAPGRAPARARGHDPRARAGGLARAARGADVALGRGRRSRIVPVIGDLTAPLLGVSDDDRERLAGRRPLLPSRRRLRHVGGRGDATAARTSRARATRSSSPTTSAPSASTTPARSPSPGGTAACSPRTCSTRARSSTTRTRAPSSSPRSSCARSCTVPWRVYRPGDRRRPLADRRDGQGRRALLLLQGDPAAARRCCRRGCRSSGSRAGKINIVPVDFVATAMDHIAHQDGPRRARLPPHRPEPEVGRPGDQHVRARRARARVRDADRPPDDRTSCRSRRARWSPSCRRCGGSPTRCWATSGSRARRSPTSTTRPTTTRATRRRRSRGRGSPSRARGLRGQALGLLGAQPRPRPVQGPQPARRDRGQGRRDHRRLERHRRTPPR